ncbi:hypothetical protein KGQ34_04670 [Patescibacteria group bacterium]|nr:hypothetical protein [Patescibacteria group bacterium]
MFPHQNLLKPFSVVAIFVMIAVSVPQREASAFGFDFGGVTFTEEVPGPLMTFNGITSGATAATNLFFTILQKVAIALAKTLIRAAINELKNQTIKWIVTGQFDKPQFVSSFQADPRKIAENASRIFLSRLTGINFCQYNQNIPSSSLLFSLKLNVQLDCTVPGLAGANGKVETDWFRAGFPTLWGITHPQNNGWDVAGRVAVEKNISEQNSLNAFYDEILTNSGFVGIKNEKGQTVTPGQYLADATKETIVQSYPDIGKIDEWTGVIQAIIDIVRAGLGTAIEKGLTKAFH